MTLSILLIILGCVAVVVALTTITEKKEKNGAPNWLEREWLLHWLAREWLILLGGLGGGLVLAILSGFFHIFFPWWWIPYVLIQMTRLTIWAVRTERR